VRSTSLALAAGMIACAIGCTHQSPGASPHRPLSASTAHLSADIEDSHNSEPALFAALDETFARKGEVKGGVYRLITPRADLFVTVNGMDVPTGAFLESDFRFWRCPCGKALVNGQFVVTDYEANDVINELQLGHLEIASLAPLLLNEHPRLLLIRFQGEGRARQLATTLKSALSYTGEARSAPARPANPARIAP
jgi:hypothetical protein